MYLDRNEDDRDELKEVVRGKIIAHLKIKEQNLKTFEEDLKKLQNTQSMMDDSKCKIIN